MKLSCVAGLVACCSAVLIAGTTSSGAQTGTFLDRKSSTDFRVAAYNVYFDAPFLTGGNRAAPFARMINAVDADVWVLTEVYSTPASSIANFFNTQAPQSNGATWKVYRSNGDDVIVSRHALSMTSGSAGLGFTQAIALVDLPNATFSNDLYLVGAHFACCTAEASRRTEADSIAALLRDARTPGGNITLPANTAMMVAGDLNIVNDSQALIPLIEGDVFSNSQFGPDAPPDWDGTSMPAASAKHNAAIDGDEWTWRDDTTTFEPGTLDYQIYTNSVLRQNHGFVLNTALMSDAELAATGLLRGDSPYNLSTGMYDHLPLVVDYAPVPEPMCLAVLPVVFVAMRRRRS